jgi:hypothetical protein
MLSCALADISCTVWEGFDDFNTWKTGDAFKEAHGGGTIGGVAEMLVATASASLARSCAMLPRGDGALLALMAR